MTIFLCGFMGCGKSTVGQKLAKTLNVPFTDILRADRHAVMHAVPGIDRHLGPYLCMILTPN